MKKVAEKKKIASSQKKTINNKKNAVNKKKKTVDNQKITIDQKMIIYVINMYFTIIIWFFLMVTIFQISNEVPLINFLLLSLLYFFLEICKGIAYYRILKINMLKLKKSERIERLKKANRKYKIVNAIVCTYIFITLALYCVYVVYFIKKTTFLILLSTIVLVAIFIIYNLINQFVQRN